MDSNCLELLEVVCLERDDGGQLRGQGKYEALFPWRERRIVRRGLEKIEKLLKPLKLPRNLKKRLKAFRAETKDLLNWLKRVPGQGGHHSSAVV